MQTHALKTYFDKMTDPQQILQDQSMDVGHPPVPEPAAPVQVVPVVADPEPPTQTREGVNKN